MILSQIGNMGVAPRSLGGGETDVLTLDVVLPSNGWQGDTLGALQVQLSSVAPAAVYGVDVLEVKLWQESGPLLGAQFNAASDTYLQRAVPSGGTLLFANIQALIPIGGQRFYVTVDMTSSPIDGRHVQLIVPINGIVMQSGNDGPLDGRIENTAVHTISSSDLLASVGVQPLLASVGQQVAVAVTIRNQGSVQLDSVFVSQLTVDPPGAAALVSGPTPTSVALAAQSEATILYDFRMLTAGEVRFTVEASELSGPRFSDLAQSPAIIVEQPPSGLALSPLSNLPPSVNRGQISVTPLVWRLTHPDSDATAADISIDTVQLHVQTSSGLPQIASNVFSALEIRTGGLVHAIWNSIPGDSVLTVPLLTPVLLTPGEQRDLPLSVSIANNASATGFQVHLEGSSAIDAVDANSGQPVTLVANLPWSTQSANILSPATTIEILTADTLPPGINQGQKNVPSGSLTFVLPGAPGQSEARSTELLLSSQTTVKLCWPRTLFRVFVSVMVRQHSSICSTSNPTRKACP
jgi:hypothetical protein